MLRNSEPPVKNEPLRLLASPAADEALGMELGDSIPTRPRQRLSHAEAGLLFQILDRLLSGEPVGREDVCCAFPNQKLGRAPPNVPADPSLDLVRLDRDSLVVKRSGPKHPTVIYRLSFGYPSVSP